MRNCAPLRRRNLPTSSTRSNDRWANGSSTIKKLSPSVSAIDISRISPAITCCPPLCPVSPSSVGGFPSNPTPGSLVHQPAALTQRSNNAVARSILEPIEDLRKFSRSERTPSIGNKRLQCSDPDEEIWQRTTGQRMEHRVYRFELAGRDQRRDSVRVKPG